MAAPMARICGESLPLRTIIVPAPTATNRVRMRGYDQSALLACNLASRIGALYDPLLCRIGSQKQIGANRAQRQAQLQGAFYTKPQYRSHHDVQGAHIILVDDVVTTGATLEAAAEALRAAGARSVEAVVFAQA